MQAAKRRRITLERTYPGSVDDVWALWTTKEGIESWWGPDGFQVKVRALDLRVGGELVYAMTAVAPPQVAFMQREGMPLTTEARVRYFEVQPRSRLGYQNLVDFVPGVEPYTASTEVELAPLGQGVKLTLILEAMHDDTWTQRAVMGWENELDKLGRALAVR